MRFLYRNENVKLYKKPAMFLPFTDLVNIHQSIVKFYKYSMINIVHMLAVAN